jgi:SEC-C motif
MIRSDLRGAAAHTEPFTIGDIDPARSFVHVLDDTTLHVLMNELDTIADFVAYLDKKEELVRTGPNFFAAGEEELVSWYLRRVNEKDEHYFELPKGKVGGLVFPEGGYERYLRNPQRIAKVKANEISYAWDALIERFNFHAMQGTQFFPTPGGISITERIMRWMAREPRTRRRMLARKLVDCVVTTPKHLRRTAVIKPSSSGDPCYIFLMIPWDDERSEQDNRELRGKLLQAACMVVRLNWPDALDVVGIASESGNETPNRSEDAMYCDFREWTDDMAEQAREWQKLLNMLVNPKLVYGMEHEYPETRPSSRPMRVGRNDLCPCGSGKKYKKCHGMSLAQRQSSGSRWP